MSGVRTIYFESFVSQMNYSYFHGAEIIYLKIWIIRIFLALNFPITSNAVKMMEQSLLVL